MKALPTLLLCFAASGALCSLAACGGGDQTPHFADAPTALDAGDRAKSANDPTTAVAAYTYAADHADSPALRYKALLGLGSTLASTDPEGAQAAFARIDQECGDQWDIRGARSRIDTWIRAGKIEEAKAALDAAVKRFPDQKADFANQEKGITAMASGNTADLSSLGYVGD